MFEKEAEIKAIEICPSKLDMPTYVQGFVNGSEFGYNKANEWHDLKKNPNDLPKENDVYLVIVGSDGTKYRSLERYYPDTKEWSTVCNILFWKEIVLPKESE